MSGRWRRVPELPGLAFYFLLHFNWCLPLEAVTATSNSLFSQVLFILISPLFYVEGAPRLGTAVICVCWGREHWWAELFLPLQLTERLRALCSQGSKRALEKKAFRTGSFTKQGFVCPGHYVWHPRGTIWNSCSPPVLTSLHPGAWLKIIHTPVFRLAPKCLKIIYVPITLHYFLTKDLIYSSEEPNTIWVISKQPQRTCIWGPHFQKDTTAYSLEPFPECEIKCIGEAQRLSGVLLQNVT